MADYRLGRAIFETAMDLAGLDRGLREAETKVRNYAIRIERQIKGGKAFSNIAPFKLDTSAIGGVRSLRRESARLNTVLSESFNILGGLVIRYVATGAAIYGVANSIRDATKKAIEFQVAMADIDTLAVNTAEEMGVLRDAVLNMAGEVAKAPTPLAKALYDIVSAGFEGTDALRVLNASARAAKGGLTTTKIAADAVTTALNAYGLAATEAVHVTDVLQTTVKYGKTTWEKLAPTIGRVIPLAASAGVSLEELGASLAILTSRGVQTTLAVTQMRSLITGIVRRTEQARKVMRRYGFDIGAATLRQKGLIETLRELKDAVHGDLDALFKFLGRVEAVNAALALTAEDAFPKLEKIVDEMKTASGVVDQAFNKQMRTAQGQIDLFTSKLDALKIELGSELLPTIGEVAKALGGLVDLLLKISHPDLGEARRILKQAGVEATGGLDVELARQIEQLKKVQEHLKSVQSLMDKLGRVGDQGATLAMLEALAKNAGVSKDKIAELHDQVLKLWRSNERDLALEKLKAFAKFLEDFDKNRIKKLKGAERAIINTPALDRAKAQLKEIERSVNQARVVAFQVGSVDLFKSAVEDAIKKLEKLRDQFKDNAKFVALVNDLIKNYQNQIKTFRITRVDQTGVDPIIKKVRYLRDLMQNITLRVGLGDLGADKAVKKLQELRRQGEALLKQAHTLGQQNAVLSFLTSLDQSVQSITGHTKGMSDAFDDWIKKLQIQARLFPEQGASIVGQLKEVRAKLIRQAQEIGPITTTKKLELLFQIDAKIQRLDSVINNLEEQVSKLGDPFEQYAKYQEERLKGIGLKLGKEANEAMRTIIKGLSGEADVGQAIQAADRLRTILADRWAQLPEELRNAADEVLKEFDRFQQGVSEAQQKLAEIIEGRRYKDVWSKLSSDLARSFTTAGQALLYLVQTGNTGTQALRALADAFGEDGRALADAADSFNTWKRAVQLGLITKEQYIQRVQRSIDILQVLIRQVDIGSDSFNYLSNMLVDAKAALHAFDNTASAATDTIQNLNVAAATVARVFKTTGAPAQQLFAGFTRDAQLSSDEAAALAKNYGLFGAALAQAGGGLDVLNAQLSAGLITQQQYRDALQQAEDALLQLSKRYADDPVLLAYYAGALQRVRQELDSLAADAGSVGKLLPQELQRRADTLASSFDDMALALSFLARDGKLTEQELRILKTAFGGAGEAVVQALDNFRLWKTQLDLGQISSEDFKRKVADILPVLQEAISHVKVGSDAWYALAQAIEAAKNAAGKPTQTKVPLPEQIGQDIGVIQAKKRAGLFGTGVDAHLETLRQMADAIKNDVSQAIADGMNPDNPEIQAAIQQLQDLEISIRLVAAFVSIRDSFIKAAEDVGAAFVNYITKGGQNAAEELHNAIVNAGHRLSNEIRQQLAQAGAEVGGKIGGEIGSQIGAGIGGAIGSATGPIGTAVGGALGYLLGDLLGSLIGNFIDWITGANQPKQPVNVPDQRVTTSVSEVNYNAVANVYYTAGSDINDPQTRAELRSFIRQTAADLLQQLGLIKGAVNA